MRVRILTAGPAGGCRCGNWLEHWNNFSHQSAGHCMADDCGNRAEVGAWVQRVDGVDRASVVPLCGACAVRRGDVIQVANGVRLVSAVVNETCGRRKALTY